MNRCRKPRRFEKLWLLKIDTRFDYISSKCFDLPIDCVACGLGKTDKSVKLLPKTQTCVASSVIKPKVSYRLIIVIYRVRILNRRYRFHQQYHLASTIFLNLLSVHQQKKSCTGKIYKDLDFKFLFSYDTAKALSWFATALQ